MEFVTPGPRGCRGGRPALVLHPHLLEAQKVRPGLQGALSGNPPTRDVRADEPEKAGVAGLPDSARPP
eukprot:1299815-Lingulodinium_polyedra.AAC.1